MTTRATRVPLSWDCTSLTSTPLACALAASSAKAPTSIPGTISAAPRLAVAASISRRVSMMAVLVQRGGTRLAPRLGLALALQPQAPDHDAHPAIGAEKGKGPVG